MERAPLRWQDHAVGAMPALQQLKGAASIPPMTHNSRSLGRRYLLSMNGLESDGVAALSRTRVASSLQWLAVNESSFL